MRIRPDFPRSQRTTTHHQRALRSSWSHASISAPSMDANLTVDVTFRAHLLLKTSNLDFKKGEIRRLRHGLRRRLDLKPPRTPTSSIRPKVRGVRFPPSHKDKQQMQQQRVCSGVVYTCVRFTVCVSIMCQSNGGKERKEFKKEKKRN